MAADEGVPAAATAAEALVPEGLVLDQAFDPIQLPSPRLEDDDDGRVLAMSMPLEFSTRPEQATILVRGVIPEDEGQQAVLAAASANPAVLGVYADPVVERCLTCIGDPPVGTHKDVARLLNVNKLTAAGMTGQGVHLAIVDTGMNVAHLRNKGQPAKLAAPKSFTPKGVPSKPGKHFVDHGTMCAFDAGIAAPQATFLDHAVLLSQRSGPTPMSGLLSDAVRSFAKLRQVLDGLPATRRALVVSNSWGMFDPAWDFPVGHPGNYSNNPRHPFNVIVASLEAAGADILFAAGNCGRECEDGRCNFRRKPICGANSHGRVLSVAGIDTKGKRVGYSSQGPGRLNAAKPDLAAYTHFKGSEVFAPDPDGGTSAACPVLAGVVAAVRTKYPSNKLSPASLRSLLFKTADDIGRTGFDHDHGWGSVDTVALIEALKKVPAARARRSAARPRRRQTAAAGRRR
jgi:subtilisin family serine protease